MSAHQKPEPLVLTARGEAAKDWAAAIIALVIIPICGILTVAMLR